MNTRRILRTLKNLVRKPFKGNIAYEWQIGSLVLLLCYPIVDRKRSDVTVKVSWFIDKYWNR